MIDENIVKYVERLDLRKSENIVLDNTMESLSSLLYIVSRLKKALHEEYIDSPTLKYTYDFLMQDMSRDIARVGVQMEQLKYMFTGEKDVKEWESFLIEKLIDNTQINVGEEGNV